MALSLKDGLQGNVSTATKLANARTLTVGNTGKILMVHQIYLGHYQK